jgi:hypothetical protein
VRVVNIKAEITQDFEMTLTHCLSSSHNSYPLTQPSPHLTSPRSHSHFAHRRDSNRRRASST